MNPLLQFAAILLLGTGYMMALYPEEMRWLVDDEYQAFAKGTMLVVGVLCALPAVMKG